jgi:hypothetical protein
MRTPHAGYYWVRRTLRVASNVLNAPITSTSTMGPSAHPTGRGDQSLSRPRLVGRPLFIVVIAHADDCLLLMCACLLLSLCDCRRSCGLPGHSTPDWLSSAAKLPPHPPWSGSDLNFSIS